MKKLLSTLLLASLLLVSGIAAADIGEKKAVSIAQGVHPGRVLAVKKEQQNGKAAYRVKTLNANGDVHIIVIDADSGKVLSQ